MNNLFEEVTMELRRMRDMEIGNQEREILMIYARAIRLCMELTEEEISKLSRVKNDLAGVRAMNRVGEATDQLVRAKKRELENWEELYNEVRRIAR